MKITSFADYALRTLMYLSVHQAERCTAKEIATFYNISLNHMVKVIHWLSTEGYIQSVKGKGGGVRLHKKPEQINLRKIFVRLEPDMKLVECFDRKNNACNIVPGCALKEILKESLEAFLYTLGQYTLQDAIQNPKVFLKKDNSLDFICSQ